MSKNSKTPRPEEIRQALLRWWDQGHRDLPWRRTKDPYAVWLAEMMLQQTRIETVIPYYERFLQHFPTVESLAEAKLDSVLKLWEGLGYYSRARHLHKAAQIIVREYGGRFPEKASELQKLPGVGRYTAGAVASIAFHQPAPLVDGNVIRVLCRLFCIRQEPTQTAVKNKLWQLAETLVCPRRPGDFNQSLMELGAVVCKPGLPDCRMCPLEMFCLAKQKGLQAVLPIMPKSGKLPEYEIAVGIVFRKGRVLIAKRKAEGLLGGLWEFPGGKREAGETLEQTAAREIREETAIAVSVGPCLTVVRHAYSHFKIVLHAFLCEYQGGKAEPLGCDAVKWVWPSRLIQYAFPAANLKIFQKLHSWVNKKRS
ncbi:MAG: A/G-specific adenine glycosylase [Anaerohalosphaeraceae bacterium]